MTKTICDICGKEMPTESPRLRKRMEIFDDEDTFCISNCGMIWDICNECRASFTRWKLMRKADGYEKVLSDYKPVFGKVKKR